MSDWITGIVEGMGYMGIAFLMFLENVFPPIPSELIMPLAGFSAGRGGLSFAGVVVAGTAGSLLGQLPLYYLGRALGEERVKAFADTHSKWLLLDADDIERAFRWFDRHGGPAVFICRLLPGIRSLISIPAGIRRMHLLPFIVWSTFGMGAWATALASAGMLLGRNYEKVEQYVGPLAMIVVAACVAGVAIWGIRRRRSGRA